MKFQILLCIVIVISRCECIEEDRYVVMGLVQMWSKKIGERLTKVSRELTREKEFKKSFSVLKNKIQQENPESLVVKIASKVSAMMKSKAQAVRNISEYAEYLSYHRDVNTTGYYFFNADNITSYEPTPRRVNETVSDVLTAECHWFNEQQGLNNLEHNLFSNETYRAPLFEPRNRREGINHNCRVLPENTQDSYTLMPLKYDERFRDYVNLNFSALKLAINVYEREEVVLEGIKWSEPLDLVFKINHASDPSITWQYFASPHGFMRHYPAVKWSTERYNQTYDFRLRPWYTEAISSPKDIIILLDRSGSMGGERRTTAMQIVNQILDTLNDNDFVNIYTFTNTTEPLVNCFNDTLFQANEENLRLLREALIPYVDIYAANFTLGMKKAFEILHNFRMKGTSARCNQAVMIITEGLDYDYEKEFFLENNINKGFPVRIFTYQVGDDFRDAVELEWIACANRGYWANITVMEAIREKMLKYLTVMSRPINCNYEKKNERSSIWSYLYVDLADRRLPNWLWKKFEELRQRSVFLDHIKRIVKREQLFFSSQNHMLLQKNDNDRYLNIWKYNYMTTVSLPVYGRREDEVELIGVAGVDVPITLFKDCIPYSRLGVNGYAFIVTNNGYILMHPDHNPEFEGILKPTFNRVDILELEILDDDNEPRLFAEEIVKMREKLVNHNDTTPFTFRVKYPLDTNKRVWISTKHYYYHPIDPFTLGIVLPDKYGFVKIDETRIETPHRHTFWATLATTESWGVHPEWLYCTKCTGSTAKEKVINAYKIGESDDLLRKLWWDMEKTSEFYEGILHEEFPEYQINQVFISTHSGLTRWKNLSDIKEDDVDSFERGNNRSIEEDWYIRTVELNYDDEEIFIYSVPFETSGYENNTMITSTKAIFVGKNSTFKTPVAVVGVQFNHRNMNNIYNNITTEIVDVHQIQQHLKELGINYKINATKIDMTCKIEKLNCYILDDNAYVILSDEPEYIGRYFGDIQADTMLKLIDNKIYIKTRMYDYQAICQKNKPELKTAQERYKEEKERQKKEKQKKERQNKNAGSKFGGIFDHIIRLQNWLLSSIILFFNMLTPFGAIYESQDPGTIAFNKLAIPKTVPTPCDHQMWLFNLNKTMKYPFSLHTPVNNLKFYCDWYYVVNKINNSNLIFLATNNRDECVDLVAEVPSPEPQEIEYNITAVSNNTLPCYIAVNNNYTRRMYMSCDNSTRMEDNLNNRNRSFCGHFWD